MKLDKYRQDAIAFSTAASEIIRNLSFAGLFVIWLFKNDSVGNIGAIPEDLFLPLFLFLVVLLFDFLQYFFPSIFWIGFYTYHRNKGKVGSDEISHVKWPSKVVDILFYVKGAVLIIGYITLLIKIYPKLFVN